MVKYYGSYFKNTDLWIVMEYCGAGSVSDIIRLRNKTVGLTHTHKHTDTQTQTHTDTQIYIHTNLHTCVCVCVANWFCLLR